MKKLILLIGNIGSGKSTIAKKFVKKGYVCICRDSLRYMIGAGDYIFNRSLEPTINKAEKKIVIEFMKLGVNLVIDEVHATEHLRKMHIDLAKKYGYHITAYVMPRLDKKTSVDRRMTNPHGQPDRISWEVVWEGFDSRYEEPTKEEGFDKIIKGKKNI